MVSFSDESLSMIIAATVIIYLNLSSFNYPWSNIYVNIKKESYVYQSIIELGIISCISSPCLENEPGCQRRLSSKHESSLDYVVDTDTNVPAFTSLSPTMLPSAPISRTSSLPSSSSSSYCCSCYNNGNLFIFPSWGLCLIPTFPPSMSSENSYHNIESILYPFQVASYPTIILMVVSSMLCVVTLVMIAITFLYPNSIKYETQKRPLRFAILCNAAFVTIYYMITSFYLNGGSLSYGWWMTSYATAIACMGYFISVMIKSEGLRANAMSSQELTYIFQNNESA